MTEASEEYRRKVVELLCDREEHGGTLPQEEEAHRVSQLDALWWEMTDEEQAELEMFLQKPVLPVSGNPLGPPMVDTVTEVGKEMSPRRAADVP